MTNSITIQQVKDLNESIFIRFIHISGSFILLTDQCGNSFTELSEAIDFVRKNESFKSHQIELSTCEQAKQGNGEWDNF